MSLSSMPTGTVSRDGAGSRTYPPDGIENGPSETASSAASAPASSATSTRASAASSAPSSSRASTTASAPSSSRASTTASAQASTASQSRGRQQSHGRQQSRGRRPSSATDARSRESLQRENEALRRANSRLSERLDNADADQQEIIDHYEQLLAESRGRGRQRTHGPSGRQNERSRHSRVESSAAETVQAAVGRVVDGVASALGRR
ncbi:hypothetical protein [Haloferax sp. KTX1]|uniref:hypothetical protein n=1 Tax=Haloferax sp. KTX1 TaxID=2600597 RepID=UPI0011DD9E93